MSTGSFRSAPGVTRLDRWAWVLWAAFALLVVVQRFDVQPSAQNVFTIYREAALRWQSGEELYPYELLFNYFPQAALLFIPWTWLPFDVGGAIWRSLNIFVFALGLWRLCGVGATATPPQARFWIASLFTLLLTLSAARYAQITLAMAGFMMLAAVDAQRGRAWPAAIFAAVAVALKPPAISLLLVLAALYPRVLWRSAVAIAVLAVLPFLLQDVDYVLRQYAAVPGMLQNRAMDREAWVFHSGFELLATLGWTASDVQQTAIRAVGALAVLALCWRAVRHPSRLGVGLSLYALTACYMLLLGYGTERNTYAMVGPVLGLVAAQAWQTHDRAAQGAVIVLAMAAVFSYTLGEAFPDTALAMLKVIVCLVLGVWVACSVLAAPRSGEVGIRGWQRRWRADA